MADGKVLEFRGVTKIFGDVAAVSDFTARIEPGVVTGFVGPNGAGKSTTLRILLGDIAPTQGTALIDGVVYKKLSNPRRTVGALLESTPYKARRTAERHLILAARAIGVPVSRVDEVLEVVGLSGVGGMRIGGFSLGMRQRLGVAEALLGDPDVLVFDEPANGLDPEGIRWMRLLMRRLADEGRTVLMSSHVLSEVQQVADNILIISNGRLLFSGGIEQLADAELVVAVDSPQRAELRDVLREHGYEFELLRSGINVLGARPSEIGELAAQAGVPLSSLSLKQQNLEDVFLKIVNGTWQGPASDAPTEGDEPAQDTPERGAVPPMPSAVTAAPAADLTAAPEPVTPSASESEPLDEAQPTATVLDAGPATAHDPLAFLDRPLTEVEKDVEAGEAALIAASPEGEQPTAGWVPTPEVVPSPAEEDADDPDQLETADETIELPDDADGTEAGEDDPAEYADAGAVALVEEAPADSGSANEEPSEHEELEGLDPMENAAHDDADEDADAEHVGAAEPTGETTGMWDQPDDEGNEPVRDDADQPDELETADEVLEVAAESAEADGGALPEVHASVDELKPDPEPTWPGEPEHREHQD